MYDIETYSDLFITKKPYKQHEEQLEKTRKKQLEALRKRQLEAQRKEKIRCFERIGSEIRAGKIKLEDLSVTLSQILLRGGYLPNLSTQEALKAFCNAAYGGGHLICNKCGSDKNTSVEKQARSADEFPSTIVTCLQCNSKWRLMR